MKKKSGFVTDLDLHVGRTVEDALLAFWAVVAEANPRATTGDFAPDEHARQAKEAERDIRIYKRILSERYEQHRVVAIKDANIDIFKARDIALVDDIMQRLWEKTASEVSHLSHGLAWEVVDELDSIPYQASLLSNEDITEDDVRRTAALAREHDWQLTRN